MDILEFLEKLATHTHYQKVIKDLICAQPEELKKALAENDVLALKKQVLDKIGVSHSRTANTSHVVQG